MPIKKGQKVQPSAPAEEPSFIDKLGGWAGLGGTGVRGVTGALAAEGGPTGALISGAGELGAEWMEGSLNRHTPWRVLAEAGLGAIPFGSVLKEGKAVASGLRGAAHAGGGEAVREVSKGEDLDPMHIAGAAATGGVFTGGLAKLLKAKPTTVPTLTGREAAVDKVARRTGGFTSQQKADAAKYQEAFSKGAEKRSAQYPQELEGDFQKAMTNRQNEFTTQQKGADARGKAIQARDTQNLKDTEKWLTDKRAKAQVDEAKASLEVQPPSVTESASYKDTRGTHSTSTKWTPKVEDDADDVLDPLGLRPAVSHAPTGGGRSSASAPAPGAGPDWQKSAKVTSNGLVDKLYHLSQHGSDASVQKGADRLLRQIQDGVVTPQKAKLSLDAMINAEAVARLPKGVDPLGIAPAISHNPTGSRFTPNSMGMTADALVEGAPPAMVPDIPQETTDFINSLKKLVEDQGKPAPTTSRPTLVGPGQSKVQGGPKYRDEGPLENPSWKSVGTKENGAQVMDLKDPSAAPAMEDTELPESWKIFTGRASRGKPLTPPTPPQVSAPQPPVEGPAELLKFFKTSKGASGANYRQAKQAMEAGEIPQGVFQDTIRAGHMNPENFAGRELPTLPPHPVEGGTEGPIPDWIKEQLETIKGMGGEKGNIDPVLQARLGLGGLGALLGGAYGGIPGAVAGGLGGAMLPSAPGAIAKAGGAVDDLTGQLTGEKVIENARKLGRNLPQWQRFSYLSHPKSLAANAVVGPYGSATMGALESALSGDARGTDALRSLVDIPAFGKRLWASKDEAIRRIEAGEMGRAEGLKMGSGASLPQKMISAPATMMTAGDVAAGGLLQDAGFTADEARRITLTSEPELPFFKGVADRGKDSPLMQFLFPFRRTPANIGEQGAQRIPGLGFITQSMRENPDPMRQQVVQQLLGAGTGLAGYEAGENLDPETAKVARRYLTNFAGQYGLPTAAGFAMGQAARAGKPRLQALASRGLAEALPLPSTEPLQDMFDMITDPNHPVSPGLVPKMVQDAWEDLKRRR